MNSSDDFQKRPTPGERFIVSDRILALERPDGETKALYIQPGDMVTVRYLPSDDDLLIDVLWSGRIVAVFRRDLLANGQRAMQAGTDS
jgi:hypothetical protein